jgi:hypothetical protein
VFGNINRTKSSLPAEIQNIEIFDRQLICRIFLRIFINFLQALIYNGFLITKRVVGKNFFFGSFGVGICRSEAFAVNAQVRKTLSFRICWEIFYFALI